MRTTVVSMMRDKMLGCAFYTTPQQYLWPGYTIIFQAGSSGQNLGRVITSIS